jgi:hypothetical protein
LSLEVEDFLLPPNNNSRGLFLCKGFLANILLCRTNWFLLAAFLLCQSGLESLAGSGVVGLDFERLAVLLYCLVDLPLLFQ